VASADVPSPLAVRPLLADAGTAAGHRLILLSLEDWGAWADLRFARISLAGAPPLQRRIPLATDWEVTVDGAPIEVVDVVGRVVEAVGKAGIADNTLILFLSDNGGLEHEQSGRVVTSNKPLRSEKGTLYEGGIRIPAIARWTGKVPAGTQCDTPLITMDVLPTFVKLGAAAMPASQPCDGVSLAAVFRDPAAALARDALHWHLPHYHHSTPASAMRQGDWKLIEFFEDRALELYDLKNDPGEQTNLATTESKRAKSMHTALQAWRKTVNAIMPVPNPDYDPAKADQLGKGDKADRKKRQKE
jgi:uncharacterized sulfatase